MVSQLQLTPDWASWQPSLPASVAMPETPYEGCDLPVEPSARGAIHQRVHQLRDPAIFEEDGHTYLLYSIAGESGLAITELLL